VVRHKKNKINQTAQEPRGEGDFQKAGKAWKMMIPQAVHAQLLLKITLKKC